MKTIEYAGLKTLTKNDNTECRIIDGASYVLIHRRTEKDTHKQYAGERVIVRVDIMTHDHQPVISYESTHAETLRKRVIAAMLCNHQGRGKFTHEHAAYIGSEIQRAFLDERFKQI